MHISDIFKRDGTTVSFEFFPPRSEEAWELLFERISDFESLGPSFVSVTYGAGGSTRQHTHDLVLRLHTKTSLDPFPHLTCIAHGAAEIEEILSRYAQAGISNILALKGDPPKEMLEYDPTQDDFDHAIDLVRYIRKFNDSGVHPDPRGFGIGVAGFPEGHPKTPNRLLQLDHLKAKVEAGADYVCSQMFFDNAEFYDWAERCELIGIRVPLVAGIMPVTSIAGMKRMSELAAGTKFPAKLLRGIYRRQNDPLAVRQIGIHWATEQCRDLLDQNVSGLHLYTLNKSDATMQIYQSLGAENTEGLR